jgi:hypothetical protein
VQFSNSATVRATGNLSGDITPFTELSPQNLAAAVWETIAADFNEAGTMGKLLNDAGAPPTAAQVADAVWNKVLP